MTSKAYLLISELIDRSTCRGVSNLFVCLSQTDSHSSVSRSVSQSVICQSVSPSDSQSRVRQSVNHLVYQSVSWSPCRWIDRSDSQ